MRKSFHCKSPLSLGRLVSKCVLNIFHFSFFHPFLISRITQMLVTPYLSHNYALISQCLLFISLSLSRNYASECELCTKSSLIFYEIFLSLLTVKYLTGKFATIFHQNYMKMHFDLELQISKPNA